MSKNLLVAAVALATMMLATGYALAQVWWGVAAVLPIALLWLLGVWQEWRWVHGVGLVLFVAAAVIGLLLQVAPGWAIVATVAALTGWDLSRFRWLLTDVAWVNRMELLKRRYQQRLLVATVLGTVVAGLTVVIRLDFGFAVALLLGLVSVVGFSRAIGFLRRESN
jgi:hypothetical protein